MDSMNLPTSAQNLQPQEWLHIMSLVHPDNVEETLRRLHTRDRMVKLLERCQFRTNHPATEEEITQILNNEPQNAQHPWPPEPEPEPQPEQEVTEPARA